MKVTLYAAVSADGFIAKKNGDSEWVSEADNTIFTEKVREKGCIVLGRKTFLQFHGDLYPMAGVMNIVLTSNSSSFKEDGVLFARGPLEALRIAQDGGYSEVLLIGGGSTNSSFLNDGLIDEMYLSVHPLLLGEGMKLFPFSEAHVELEFLLMKAVEGGLVQLHYRFKK